MNEIVMPKLSDTMTEGRLVSWKKRVGEPVQRGEVIAEVETDKANMELEAFTEGVLLETKAKPGDMVQVGTVIAIIGSAEEKGEAQPPEAQQGKPEEAQPKPEAKPQPEAAKPQPEAEQKKTEEAATAVAPAAGGEKQPEAAKPEPKAAEPEPQPKQAPAAAAPVAEEEKEAAARQGELGAPTAIPGAAPTETGGTQTGKPGETSETEKSPAKAPTQGGAGPGLEVESRERAAPVVRRRARELNIELGQVKGSGPDGRILLQDLEQYQKQPVQPGAGGQAPRPPEGKQPPAAAEGGAKEMIKPLSRLRGAVAKIVSDSWHNIPHFTVTMEIAMDDAVSLQSQLKRSETQVTLNDLVVKGVALALLKFPQMNAAVTPEGLRQRGEVNIGVAVGVRDGVLVPVIRGCDGLSLLEISLASHHLASRARSGALTEQEMSGGTFSVSNLGMYGVSHFTAIIYPSQAGVLAIGAVADKLVLRAGIPAASKVMNVTLCADHRVVDGAYAAEFLSQFKMLLENPARLLL